MFLAHGLPHPYNLKDCLAIPKQEPCLGIFAPNMDVPCAQNTHKLVSNGGHHILTFDLEV